MVELQLGGVLDVVRIGVLVAWGEEIVEAGEHTRSGGIELEAFASPARLLY